MCNIYLQSHTFIKHFIENKESFRTHETSSSSIYLIKSSNQQLYELITFFHEIKHLNFKKCVLLDVLNSL